MTQLNYTIPHNTALDWLSRFLMAVLSPGDSAQRQHQRELTFREVLDRYDDLIIKLCFGYANTADELEDLHQDVLINVWQGLERFRGDSSLKTWIYRVTLNTCVSTLRRRSREVSYEDSNQLYDIIDDSAERREMMRELHEAIAQLSPVDKAIILLWLDEFNYEQIAELTGMGRNTVATRLRRAKEKLKTISNS